MISASARAISSSILKRRVFHSRADLGHRTKLSFLVPKAGVKRLRVSFYWSVKGNHFWPRLTLWEGVPLKNPDVFFRCNGSSSSIGRGREGALKHGPTLSDHAVSTFPLPLDWFGKSTQVFRADAEERLGVVDTFKIHVVRGTRGRDDRFRCEASHPEKKVCRGYGFMEGCHLAGFLMRISNQLYVTS